MLAHVQHLLAPAAQLRLLGTEATHQVAQDGELRLGQRAVLGLLVAQHRAQLQLEIGHLGQFAVMHFDGQDGAAVERHLLQRGVDLVHALLDRLVRLGGVALQGQQVVLALGLQQLEEAAFVARQAIALQPVQTGQEILGTGQRHGEVGAVFGPLLDEAAEAVQHLPGQPGIAALAVGQLVGQRALDHPEMAFHAVQVQARQHRQALIQQRPLAFIHAFLLQLELALLALLFQAHAFAAQLGALQAHVFIGAAGLVAQAAGNVDLFGDLRQRAVALAQGHQLLVDVIDALQTATDIDLVPFALGQGVRGQLLLLGTLALAAQRIDIGIAGGDARGQLLGLALVDPALVAVVMAQHPQPAVVDRVAVILFVTVARMLDLALAGQAAVLVAQLGGTVDAGVVEAAQQFVVDPVGVGVVADLELVDQRARIGLLGMQQLVVAHPEIDQLGAQVGAVDPVGDLRVVLFIHQQRLRKTVQHAFDRAAPGQLVIVHLQQFADKRQQRLGDAGVLGQPRTQVLQRCRDRTGRGLERIQLGAQLVETLFIGTAFAHPLGDGFIHRAGALPAPGQQLARRLDLLGKAGRVLGQADVQMPAGTFQLLAPAQAVLDLTLDPGALALELIDPLAALLALLAFQLDQLLLVVVHRLPAGAFLALQPAVLDLDILEPLVDQRQALFLAETIHAVLQRAQVGDAAAQLLQRGMQFARRAQGLDLAAGGHHRMVGAVELGKVLDQAVGGLEGAWLIEHEPAQETVQIAQVLGRLGLVQQPQRHVIADAQQMAETLGIAGETVEVGHVLAQPQAQLAQVQVEAFHLGGDVKPARDHHVVLAHVGRGSAGAVDPEQADDGNHIAARTFVGQHQGGPGRALAQVLGGDLARSAVLLVGPGTAHVGDQVAVTPGTFGFARGGVEIDDARRGQQRAHRVQQGRLARAGTANEQEAALGDRHIGQAGEGAPVVDLQPAHPELVGARIGERVMEQRGGRQQGVGGVVHQRCPWAQASVTPAGVIRQEQARCIHSPSRSSTGVPPSRSWR